MAFDCFVFEMPVSDKVFMKYYHQAILLLFYYHKCTEVSVQNTESMNTSISAF